MKFNCNFSPWKFQWVVESYILKKGWEITFKNLLQTDTVLPQITNLAFKISQRWSKNFNTRLNWLNSNIYSQYKHFLVIHLRRFVVIVFQPKINKKHHHYHHQVVLIPQILLTQSRYQSFLAPGVRTNLIGASFCWSANTGMPCVGVHGRMFLISSSQLH